MIWWGRISANSLCESPRIPRLFILSVQRTVVQVSLNLSTIFVLIYPHLLVIHEREIQIKPWLAIYFIYKMRKRSKIIAEDKNTRQNLNQWSIKVAP
jgi:hypothetical protein